MKHQDAARESNSSASRALDSSGRLLATHGVQEEQLKAVIPKMREENLPNKKKGPERVIDS